MFSFAVPPVSVKITQTDKDSDRRLSSKIMISGTKYSLACGAQGSSPFVLYNWTLSTQGAPDMDIFVILMITITIISFIWYLTRLVTLLWYSSWPRRLTTTQVSAVSLSIHCFLTSGSTLVSTSSYIVSIPPHTVNDSYHALDICLQILLSFRWNDILCWKHKPIE